MFSLWKKSAAKAPAADAAKAPACDETAGDLAAVAAAIGIYLEQATETVLLTEVERRSDQLPWTAFGIRSQSTRFQRWQAGSSKQRGLI